MEGAECSECSETVALLVQEGETALLHGDFEKATWALDSARSFAPSLGRRLWQRGLCCYYTGRYREGVEQFHDDMEDNGSDVEEVVWHFLCSCKLVGFEEATRRGFLTLRQDPHSQPPPPMLNVLQLYQSCASVEDVVSAATGENGEVVKSYNDTNALAYAHFYVGLYYEARKMLEQAELHLSLAAGMNNPDYIGRLMSMHYRLFQQTKARRVSVPTMSIPPASSSSPSISSSYSTSSIMLGGWQLSHGHNLGANQTSKAHLLTLLLNAVDRGITTFDCGDLYTGVEELYGSLINAYCHSGGKREDIHIHTKLAPDLDVIRGGKVNQNYVDSVLHRSLNRLHTDYVDLVQFHWWDYSQPGYVDAARYMCHLQRQGFVRQIGLTNFDAEHMRELLAAGIPIASTQVQVSLLDRRPLQSGLLKLCQENGVAVFAYGVLAGGFLSDAWCGRACPQQFANRSLVKYLLIIDEFVGWDAFQQLLQTLKDIADNCPPVVMRKGGGGGDKSSDAIPVTVAMVAVAYVLSLPGVSGVIVGSVKPNHLEEAIAASKLTLSDADCSAIEKVLHTSRGPQGGVYQLERESDRHSCIMKCNLNQLNQPAHLEELCARFLQLYFKAYPEEATRSGYRQSLPDISNCLQNQSSNLSYLSALQEYSYDHSLTLSSSREIDDHCQRVERLLTETLNIDTSTLDKDQSVDHDLIISQLRLELVKWKDVAMHRKDPAFYLPFQAINYLLPVWGSGQEVKQFGSDLRSMSHPGVAELSVTHRLLALLSRLRAIPQLVTNAKANLTTPVRIFVERTIRLCDSFEQYLSTDFMQLVQTLASFNQPDASMHIYTTSSIVKELAMAAQVAAKAIAQFKRWLQQEVIDKAVHAPCVGKEVYEKLLLYGHYMNSSDELLLLGERHLARVKSLLDEVARSIDPCKTWQEVTEHTIHCLHPRADELLQSYMDEIHRARDFFTSCNVLPSLPEGEYVHGFYTPPFLVPFSPFGDFLNPSPFAVESSESSSDTKHRRTGYLMLHSVSAMELPPQEEESLLRGHDYSWISVIAPHECYPGHHVQALLAQQHHRLLRKFYESTLFYEGWGLYCENLAYELGFFRKEVTVFSNGKQRKLCANEYEKMCRLTQLRLQLWRSARIIMDVKFHRGELTFAECQEFLQREVMFSPRSTAGEVFMYASRPTYASCYVAGYLNLMQLRDQIKKRCVQEGAVFELKKFHELLLNKGCLPFQLLEKLL